MRCRSGGKTLLYRNCWKIWRSGSESAKKSVCIRHSINNLLERNYSNRKVAFIGNGSWAPMANKVMKEMFEKSKNIEFAENNVKIMSALNDDSIIQIKALAKELS